MTVNRNYKNLRAGLKYGALAIPMTLLFSPILYLSVLFFETLKEIDVVYWDQPFVIFFAVGLFVLVFFSLPYLIGGCVLGMLAGFKKISPEWLGAVTGLISGLMGLLLMALFFGQSESYRGTD